MRIPGMGAPFRSSSQARAGKSFGLRLVWSAQDRARDLLIALQLNEKGFAEIYNRPISEGSARWLQRHIERATLDPLLKACISKSLACAGRE